MTDIPHNLSLDQCFAPTYANYPRLSGDAVYDPVLKAFVAAKSADAADKMRETLRKSNKASKSSEDDVSQCRFLCEMARSRISKCRKCGKTIEKSALRFGYPSPDPRGVYGAIPIWFHIRCTPMSFIGFDTFDKTMEFLCEGFALLEESVQIEIIQTCGKGYEKEYANDFDDDPSAISNRLVERRGVTVPLLPTPLSLASTVTMLGYQQEGFSWMMAQEDNRATRGGILADEMGMGKTLQAIALIVAKKDTVRPTLVICPVAAVMQWYSEIEKFVAAPGLSVHVYHGTGKIKASQLAGFDVVLTTYQTLENEYRKEANKAKVKCKYCKKLFLPGKLTFHLKYMCGPNAMRTAKQSLQKTKHKVAAETAKKSMGISAPTPSNILREVMVAGGHVDAKDVEGMSQYQLMRKWRTTGQPDEERAEEEVSETKPDLQTFTVAELKKELTDKGVDTKGIRKKVDLIDLLNAKLNEVEAKQESLVKPKNAKEETVNLLAKTKEQAVKPLVQPVKRAAARKVVFTKESDSEEEMIKPVKRGAAKKVVFAKESDSDESEDANDSEESDVSSSELSDSESSVSSESSDSTIMVDSDESEVSFVPKRAKVGAKTKYVASAERPEKVDAENMESASENEVEDIDLNNSPLHSVKWGRLILDEAHRIKAHTNSTSMAAFAIAAEYRWCLSGTPLQNRVGELYSLIRFLRFAPFAHYFCKGCDCKSLHFRFIDNRFCQKCGCSRIKHYSYFKQVISGPIVKFGLGDGVALKILKSQVLDSVLLRRTKIERQADLNLPSMSIEIKKIKLSVAELDFYESIFKQSVLQFDTFAKSGTLLHNYAHIFDLLTRLRQALDHPYLITYGADYSAPSEKENATVSRGICALCQDDIGPEESSAHANCRHKFHSDCVKEYIREAPQLVDGGTGCPACFVPLTLKFEDPEVGSPDEAVDMSSSPTAREKPLGSTAASTPTKMLIKPTKVKKDSIMDRVGAAKFESSTKIESVVEEVMKLAGTESKVLIFSQFTRMLDLVEFRIKQNGIGCAKLTGALSLAQRSNIILAFNTDPSMRALLISLKAGGEGLNLQVADHVFLLDPWWNPACELQAIQRAHRIGQTRPVKAVRIVTENSIEEKVVALQEMKQLVFDATVGQSEGAEKKLTESDLRFLFNH